jgi:hypothetical protein
MERNVLSLARVRRRLAVCVSLSLFMGLLATLSTARAQTIMGLGTITGPNFRNVPVGSQGLILIDPNNGASLNLAPVSIAGITPGQTLIGIDFRPANNLLYTLGYDAATAGTNAQLYILNPGTNVVSPVGSAIRLDLGGAVERIGFDFNPVADRIRVTSSNEASYRLNPTTGGIAATDTNLAYAGGLPANPGICAVAYSNSFLGSGSTTLYDFDRINNGLLSIQNPPNNGTLTSPVTCMFQGPGGNFGVGSPTDVGLDIYYNPSTNLNEGYLTEVTERRPNGTASSNTYRINLSTGQAILMGNTIPASNLFNFEIRDLAVALAPIPLITWNGSTSTDWRTPANWTPAQVPAAANNIIIPGGTPFPPTVSQPQQAHAVTLTAGATLNIPSGGVLIAGGDFINNGGTLASSGSGTVILDLNTPQTIGGTSPTTFQNLIIGSGTASLATAANLAGPAAVRGVLTLFGNLTVTGQTFTLLSDASGTATVVNLTGAVIGDATVQRYTDPSRNAGLGYRHYSSPVTGSTVGDLATAGFTPVVNAAYNSVGTSVTPFPTVYGYNEQRVITNGRPGTLDFDRGYFSPSSLGDALLPTRGYTVNIAPTTLDFVGTLSNGTLVASGLSRGNLPQSGWHLLGNPYPAPLDWDSVMLHGGLSSVEPALYVFKSSGQYSGSYASYINGVGANGGSSELPLGQGFFVRVSAPGASGSVTFGNADRLRRTSSNLFQRGANDPRPQLALSLRSASQAAQTVVYVEQGATAAFDHRYDAEYLPGPSTMLLTTEAGSQLLAINGLPLLTGADVLAPLQLSAPAGSYSFVVDALVNLPAGYHAYLRDAVSGSYSDLATTPSVLVNLAANAPTAGRYALLFTTQTRVLATAPADLAQLVSVYPNPAHGTATLLLPQALRGNQATAVQVVDNLGRVVLSRSLAPGAATLELSLSGLAAGVYSVQAKTAVGMVVKRLVVE